jgi:hypothetical protein
MRALLGPYRQHVRAPSEDGGGAAAPKRGELHERFDEAAFVEGASEGVRPFLKELRASQASRG